MVAIIIIILAIICMYVYVRACAWVLPIAMGTA